MNNKILLSCLLTAAMLPAVNVDANPALSGFGNDSGLKIATWNVEHLAFPANKGCNPRTPEQISQLKTYAQSLNADVVALQEVASAEAVAQIFPAKDWNVFISDRPDSEAYQCRETGRTSTQQKVAYAVKKQLTHVKVKSLKEFALGNPGLRYALELTLPTKQGTTTLLNVHMKSGCFVDDHTRKDSEACQIFTQQAPLLDAWVENKEKQGQPYAVLGDFNHRLSANYNQLTRTLTSNSDGSESTLVNTVAGKIGCHPYYPAAIDHIFVGHMPKSDYSLTANIHHYDNMQPKAMLSDHCAVSVGIDATDNLTAAVKWQTQSAEYQLLTSNIYQRAADSLSKLSPSNENWVVVMDVDETVLDNSQYQVRREGLGLGYSSGSWDQWVSEQQATLVPGAKAFIEAVIAKGGKLALVTNRKRHTDKYTWNNLLALGLPITAQNTCLVGRVKQDKASIDGKQIINDKDLRRQQLQNGTAACFNPTNGQRTKFSDDHYQILMQVGDNIEDFAEVTQHGANIQLLLEQSDNLILLPNPMYGSW
ncbi:HAD family acid phosphatase [Paraferrimonas sp. SM1919]|uniref:HAD family acid phosphatase n=1 Tax=Paraferrimonas sp. SM1919 TaxID=2662263 RepID=UPI0013D1440A|nr:HAD family acid phosphatase [Paraferrimonas sp. SM1919]